MASIQTSVRLEEKTVDRIKQLAQKDSRSFNNMVNVLLAEALKLEKEGRCNA